MISARRINKVLGEKQILTDVSLDILKGKCSVLLGPNGSGKTIFLQCLSQVLEPDSGEINLDGILWNFPKGEGNPAKPWPRVSVLFQNLLHWPHLTFEESLDLVAKGASRSKLTESLIERLELKNLLGRRPHECSGGQRQRFALVRALSTNPFPEYLLADEPTSAVDMQGALELAEVFKELKYMGLGLLVVTHQMGFAARVGDRFHFLFDGTIVENGDVSMLTKPANPRTREFMGIMQANP